MRLPPDAGFIGRVYKTSAVVAAIFALPIAGYFGWLSAANFALGVALGLALLRLLELSADRIIGTNKQRAKAVLGLIGAAKYIAVAAGLYALAATGCMRPLFLVAGYALTHLVIALKCVGRLMVQRWGEGSPDERPQAAAPPRGS
jgi:hypothetical protein